ncbi:MAG: hypothetical protein KDB14_15085 [Planctomycetales bacterium]|nr:hypothetical protein [Planctomycetales bacterium]
MAVAPLALLFVLVGQQPPHLESNPVYRMLINEGIFENQSPGKLPTPTMADGLSRAEQRAIIDKLSRHDFATLTRKSVVAPHIVDIHKVDSGDPDRPLQSIEFWFIAHASLDAMSDKEFLDSLLTAEDSEGETLDAEALKARGIEIVDKERESYGQIIFPLLKKVRLHATGRSYWSRTKESILTAAIVDPRFRKDDKFSNQWQPLDREGRAGPAESYTGAGLYMKITNLQQPAGTVFVECHIRGVEPKGWFGGVNLLASKLPPAIQNQVRSVRRSMMKAKDDKKE